MTETTETTGLPRLTVLIPVHNGENYLAEAIESALAQMHPAAEILVVNDGSTDATGAIAASFGDRIKLLNREYGNVSKARNEGISIAQTEWVALLDHDDVWEPNHLANLARAIARDPLAAVAYAGARRLVRNPQTGIFEKTATIDFPGEGQIAAALMDRCAFITSSSAVRRTAVLDAGGFDSHYLNVQDWDLWLRLLHRGGRFLYASGPTLLYRMHSGSRTNAALRGLRFSRDVVERDILPYLSPLRRIVHGQRVISRLEGEASLLLREGGDIEGARSLMLRSILRYPFHAFHRYKIAVHMLLIGLKTAPDTQFSGQTK